MPKKKPVSKVWHVFLQVLGTVPTISINKTEGCQVYLSKDSVSCDIVSAKSSEMNIMIPEGEDDYVSNRDKDSELILSVCAAFLTLTLFLFSFFFNTEGVPSAGAVQDCVGWIQTGDRTHGDRRLTLSSIHTQIYFRPPDVTPQTYSAVKSTFPLHNFFFCIVVTRF